MKEILDKTESNDEWKNAYTVRGGIPDDGYNPFTPDASVSLLDQEGSEQYISLDDVESNENNAEMQVDNTTPATITSKVTCCAAGDLCTAPIWGQKYHYYSVIYLLNKCTLLSNAVSNWI
jgi:hypothetical protein